MTAKRFTLRRGLTEPPKPEPKAVKRIRAMKPSNTPEPVVGEPTVNGVLMRDIEAAIALLLIAYEDQGFYRSLRYVASFTAQLRERQERAARHRENTHNADDREECDPHELKPLKRQFQRTRAGVLYYDEEGWERAVLDWRATGSWENVTPFRDRFHNIVRGRIYSPRRRRPTE